MLNRIGVSQNVIFFQKPKLLFYPSRAIAFFYSPYFPDDVSPPIMVYERCHHKDVPLLPPHPNPSPAPDLATTTSPDAATPSSQVPLRRSTRLSRPPDRNGFNHTFLLATLSSIASPNSYSQVVKHDCWKKAIQEELAALQSNHTWI